MHVVEAYNHNGCQGKSLCPDHCAWRFLPSGGRMRLPRLRSQILIWTISSDKSSHPKRQFCKPLSSFAIELSGQKRLTSLLLSSHSDHFEFYASMVTRTCLHPFRPTKPYIHETNPARRYPAWHTQVA
jgi:hypothetical protein